MAEAVVATLRRLVAWPTVSHRPLDALAGYLAERAERAGMRVRRLESSPGKVNLVAVAGPVGRPGGLTLSGHMDVVPVDDQDWSSDPFCLTERDGRLHGRGTCDMKGFLAATVEALDSLPLHRLRRPLALVWTHDEEVGCLGSARLAETLGADDHGLPQATVIGEPTGFEVLRLHPGHTTVAIEARGRSAHSSRPGLGLSAIELVLDAAAACRAWAAELAERTALADVLPTPYTSVNLGRIEGGSAVNIVPERCRLELGLRPLPGVDTEALLAELETRLEPVRTRAVRLGGSVELVRLQRADPLLTSPRCAHLPLLQECARAAGSSGQPGGAPFATDGGNLARLGLEALVFGPGSIDEAHRPDESLHKGDLLRTVPLLQQLVQARCLHPATA
jgi:acetylornithine deacetylase